ncbi:MAG TPA: tetratricopeptide repeat protein [Pseudonocardiaceae bacterium]|jgi:tetratricopeptide (TPR) repeat protein|nr:tetratricopeptide repeat protein [Pseudonocardiaceae bacterium]
MTSTDLPPSLADLIDRDAELAELELSYAGLHATDKAVFRFLGLVPGPDIDLAAAAALCGQSIADVDRSLDRLVAADLVRRGRGDRYDLHDLSLRCAAEWVRRDEHTAERIAATYRLLDWYVGRATAAVRLCCPDTLRLPVKSSSGPQFADRMAALTWLDADAANLLAVIRHTSAHGPYRIAVRLADALCGYHRLRCADPDGLRCVDPGWLESATAGLAAATAANDVAGQCVTEFGLGDAYRCLGRDDETVEHYRQAVEHSRAGGWTAAEAVVSGNLGDVCRRLGRLPEALSYYHKALRLYRKSGPRNGLADTLDGLGLVYLALGRLDLAEKQLTESIVLHRKLGNAGALAAALDSLAGIHRDAGRTEAALAAAAESLAIAAGTDDRCTEAEAANTLGSIRVEIGRYTDAVADHERALRIGRKVGSPYLQTMALTGLARANHLLGRRNRARRAAEDAVAMSRHGGYPALERDSLAALAEITRPATQQCDCGQSAMSL